MPAYNFKARWIDKIRDGSKAQTIRRRRVRETRAGEMLSLYTGMRTKSCQLIARAPCIMIMPLDLDPDRKLIKVGFVVMDPETALGLAIRDGFDDLESFFDFFRRYNKPDELRDMVLIRWDPRRITMEDHDGSI